MKRPKKHYKVYVVGTGEGCYAKDYCREYAGETYAVSEKQACNNVRYQHRNNKNPNGGYATSVIEDAYEEGSVLFTYEAVEIQ